MRRILMTAVVLLSLTGRLNAMPGEPKTAMIADVELGYDTERGFRHPGGLHTQADFDRVKKQLANGNRKVTEAYNILKNAAYAQPTVQTSPVETIVRGGSGENYINAARGATMAYQNALRWKIEGNESCAKAAVRILMSWANVTKNISGTSDQCLAVGLYGYQFAQAAELMRDYEGWARSDFERFKWWMLNLWYPKAIGFLRNRNGTWENSGKWWQAPGHYWSNWGLCNVMCVISIGILCDDVFIYNQGMSYYKYDQVGTFKNPRTDNPIKNDGLTEFLGNLVVTTVDSELETGAYGQLGQMNESGRDTGHSAMALGLAIDVAKVGWNQGDDLFSYMNHRLAAGIEYVAAQTQSVPNLPWTNYHYGSNGYYYTDSRAWLMTEPALGAQMRPYWGTVIGIYESVKGVTMPFSEQSYNQMGIDGGGQGSTSGGYDHLGYSVLMNTYEEQLATAEKVPTELSPKIEYGGTLNTNLIPSLSLERQLGNVDGNVTLHGELGGLVNTYQTNNKTCVPYGMIVKLMPQLPDGEEDTGLWSWNTGEKERNITVVADKSYVYRVTYTNKNGVKSEQAFTIAVEGDCNPSTVQGTITYNGESIEDTEVEVFYGDKVTLNLKDNGGYGTYEWETGQKTASVTVGPIKEEQFIRGTFFNQGGARTSYVFHIKVKYIRQDISINGATTEYTEPVMVDEGDKVVIGPYVPASYPYASYRWNTGETTRQLTFEKMDTTGVFTVDYSLNGETGSYVYEVITRAATSPYHIAPGIYQVRHRATDTYLYFPGSGKRLGFLAQDQVGGVDSLVWRITECNDEGRFQLQTMTDGSFISSTYRAADTAPDTPPFRVDKAAGAQMYALLASNGYYLKIGASGNIMNDGKTITAYPFDIIPYDGTLGIGREQTGKEAGTMKEEYFTLTGIRTVMPRHGVYVVRRTMTDGSIRTRVITIR